MFKVKNVTNVTNDTWVKEYIVGKWLKETIESEDAGLFDKKSAERLVRLLSDEDVKYKKVGVK